MQRGSEIAKIHPEHGRQDPDDCRGPEGVQSRSLPKGIKTNVTLIFSANQALLAARAGATYVSPFLGRLDDISVTWRGPDSVRSHEIFAVAGDIDIRDHRSKRAQSDPCDRLCTCRSRYCNRSIQRDRADDTSPIDRRRNRKVPGRL